jgi:hypothetical protein
MRFWFKKKVNPPVVELPHYDVFGDNARKLRGAWDHYKNKKGSRQEAYANFWLTAYKIVPELEVSGKYFEVTFGRTGITFQEVIGEK